ncbi:hypothetical protein PIB30_064287 [Stylosanthes scabra]|uniref:Uncharacterized protein n=1 Tax=Stylosanthes scabra TaxID=79078 RepID=A0ABU6VKN0_9FABA|nr:hypothetical protein [Stylosanthes scabra]
MVVIHQNLITQTLHAYCNHGLQALELKHNNTMPRRQNQSLGVAQPCTKLMPRRQYQRLGIQDQLSVEPTPRRENQSLGMEQAVLGRKSNYKDSSHHGDKDMGLPRLFREVLEESDHNNSLGSCPFPLGLGHAQKWPMYIRRPGCESLQRKRVHLRFGNRGLIHL